MRVQFSMLDKRISVRVYGGLSRDCTAILPEPELESKHNIWVFVSESPKYMEERQLHVRSSGSALISVRLTVFIIAVAKALDHD
jgi:hypothetical protein